jgi:protein-tyrosine phosphatase
MPHGFDPASPGETTVFGVCRPGYPSPAPADAAVQEWIAFMHEQDIDRVCCLLSDKLTNYDGLLDHYRAAFGPQNVCHAPIDDYTSVPEALFHDVVLPFLQEADADSDRVVVHCSAGMGRTGQILVLWLVHERHYDLTDAVDVVEAMGRNPLEAATLTQLTNLCRD